MVTIHCLQTDNFDVALVIAAHNAALSFTTATAGPEAYARNFRTIYEALVETVDHPDDEDE